MDLLDGVGRPRITAANRLESPWTPHHLHEIKGKTLGAQMSYRVKGASWFQRNWWGGGHVPVQEARRRDLKSGAA